MPYSDIEKYVMSVIGKKTRNIRVIRINIPELSDNDPYVVKYNYLDEDNMYMEGSMIFTRNEYNFYLRKQKLDKINYYANR